MDLIGFFWVSVGLGFFGDGGVGLIGNGGSGFDRFFLGFRGAGFFRRLW